MNIMEPEEVSDLTERRVKRASPVRNHGDRGASVAAVHGIERSHHWDEVVREHLSREPSCVCCSVGHGSIKTQPAHGVQVHHIFPFHYCIALGRHDLELDERNLITLCGSRIGAARGQNHHLWVGHLDDFQTSNLSVARDARTTFNGMQAAEFSADARWLRRVRSRLVALELKSDDEKELLLRLMNRRMPR
jgi:hypothetical protein